MPFSILLTHDMHNQPRALTHSPERGTLAKLFDNQIQKTQLLITFTPRVTMRPGSPVIFPFMPVLPE